MGSLFSQGSNYVGTSERRKMVIRPVSIEAYVSNRNGKAEMRHSALRVLALRPEN